jgi:hypothetical protein
MSTTAHLDFRLGGPFWPPPLILCLPPCCSLRLDHSLASASASLIPAWHKGTDGAHHRPQVPSWHAHFVLRHSPPCPTCDYAFGMFEAVAHKAYQDAELRMCVTFGAIDHSADWTLSPRQRLLAGAREPTLQWVPSTHEEHALQSAPAVRLASTSRPASDAAAGSPVPRKCAASSSPQCARHAAPSRRCTMAHRR